MRPFSREERKALFDGKQVSSLLPYDSLEGNVQVLEIIREGNGRLSISGAQEKFAMVEDGGSLRFTRKGERGKYILKPIPADYRFYLREDMPANEYLTMHIARNVYHLSVAAHGLVFFGNGQPAYLTRRFDYLEDGRKAGMEDLASIAGLNASTSGSDVFTGTIQYCRIIYHAANIGIIRFAGFSNSEFVFYCPQCTKIYVEQLVNCTIRGNLPLCTYVGYYSYKYGSSTNIVNTSDLAEGAQLRLHQVEFLVLRVIRIVAPYI